MVWESELNEFRIQLQSDRKTTVESGRARSKGNFKIQKETQE